MASSLIGHQHSAMNRYSQTALGLIILVYLAIGVQYAALTPAWQAPDEPAHYNVIRQIAQTGRLPRLEVGDYDQAYLEQVVGQGFPQNLPVEALEYQDYQPPLYYMLLTPVFWLFGGSLLPLRLASLLLGAGAVIFAFLAVREVTEGHPHLPLLAAGFIAFIPQFMAIMASVNNDSLSLLWVGLGTWLALRAHRSGNPEPEFWALGLVLGLAFITKVWAYVLVPVVLGLLFLRWRSAGRFPLRPALIIFVPALLLGTLYWGRNWLVCGPLDVVCGNWHNQVVVGQPTTVGWIAQYGWGDYVERLVTFTFDSFWGVFGWLGVFMDSRVYWALWLYSAGLVLGAMAAVSGQWSVVGRQKREALILLLVLALITLALYAYYNLSFVQHQGRYLFPALIPIGLAAAGGLWQWAGWGQQLMGRLPAFAHWKPQVQVALAWVPIGLMAALSVFALYRFILPAL